MKQLVIKIGGNMGRDLEAVFMKPAKSQPGTHTLYIKSSKELYEMLTPKRLELLMHVISQQAGKKTISELANELDRKQEAVSRDANILAKYSLVQKTKERQMVYLKALYKSLDIRLGG